AGVGLVDLYPVQAARVAEVAPDADPAVLIVGAEREQMPRPESERALRDAVVREGPGVQKRVRQGRRETRDRGSGGDGQVESGEGGGRHGRELGPAGVAR